MKIAVVSDIHANLAALQAGEDEAGLARGDLLGAHGSHARRQEDRRRTTRVAASRSWRPVPSRTISKKPPPQQSGSSLLHFRSKEKSHPRQENP